MSLAPGRNCGGCYSAKLRIEFKKTAGAELRLPFKRCGLMYGEVISWPEIVAKSCVPPLIHAIDRPKCTIKIPEPLKERAKVGARVTVPFSRGNRRAEGVILALAASKGDIRLKCIDKVLDDSPPLTEAQIKLALWLRERYFCTVYDALRVMLRPGLWV